MLSTTGINQDNPRSDSVKSFTVANTGLSMQTRSKLKRSFIHLSTNSKSNSVLRKTAQIPSVIIPYLNLIGPRTLLIKNDFKQEKEIMKILNQ